MFSPSQLSDSLVGNRLGGGASSPPSPSMYGPPITDDAELQEYLQQYKEKEKLRQISKYNLF